MDIFHLMEWFLSLKPVAQAFLATCFTWLVTALGAAMVFFFKTIDRRVLNAMLGFAAGVMTAASFWSLLAPAIEMAEIVGHPHPWIPAAVGVAFGAVAAGLRSHDDPRCGAGLSGYSEMRFSPSPEAGRSPIS